MGAWIDTPEKDPYNGCLVVMNVGQENISQIPETEIEQIVRAISEAHAAGNAVIYLFDSDIGPMGPPEEFDVIAGMDGIRMAANAVGMRTIKFSDEIETQKTQMEKMGKDLAENVKDCDLRFVGPVQFCGYCILGEWKAFVSPT